MGRACSYAKRPPEYNVVQISNFLRILNKCDLSWVSKAVSSQSSSSRYPVWFEIERGIMPPLFFSPDNAWAGTQILFSEQPRLPALMEQSILPWPHSC